MTNDRIITISKLLVVQSLRGPGNEHERETGRELVDDLHTLLTKRGLGPAIEFVDIADGNELREVVERATLDALTYKRFCVLHIECHGGEHEGLEFRSGPRMSWPDFCGVLRPLNRAMGLNLLTCVAACFGDAVTQHIAVSEPAPAVSLIGPPGVVYPQELYTFFLNFYLDLFHRTDSVTAVNNLTSREMKNGHMSHLPVKVWFELLMHNYLDNYATPDKLDERAAEQHRHSIADNNPMPVDVLRERFIHSLPVICRKYFDQFFMTSELPDTYDRYAESLSNMEKKLRALGYAT